MRYREVQDRLRTIGILISKRGNRIRVNHFGGIEDTAYYTDSLDDALAAGMKMARPDHLPRSWCSYRR
ncbi:hypothetical protein PV773_23795 [Mesorhizobium sp. CC13]|uniref:hypothetical protein n=1 Tax=Mesorhizobium sp. CC13 TaxID=3029194 RepID=UPI0032649E80